MYAGVDKFGGGIVGQHSGRDGIALEEAIETAAAEETIVVNVPLENGYERMVTLKAQLNPECGGLQWLEQASADSLRDAVSMSQMTSMVCDADRNECYERAIRNAIENFRQKYDRRPVVLDIGTGTGLLALFAAKHGASRVFACEMFATMADIARNVVQSNSKCTTKCDISIFPVRSTDLAIAGEENSEKYSFLLPERADILISELLDSNLLGEGVLMTLNHAREHLCKKDVVVIPERAVVYAQCVESVELYHYHSLPHHALDENRIFSLARDANAFSCRESAPPLPLRQEVFQKCLRIQSEPFIAQTISFSDDSSISTSRSVDVRIKADGVIHAIIMWWELSFDAKDEIRYSTAIGAQNWQDHWVQTAHVFSTPRIVSAESSLTVYCLHDALRVWFSLDSDVIERPPCSCGIHLLCNSERICMLNDSHRLNALMCTIKEATDGLKDKVSDLTCLDISDGSVCGMLAALSGISNVTSIESKDVSAIIFEQIVREYQKRSSVDFDMNVLCCGVKGLTEEHLEWKVHLLAGEPFYYSMQNLTLWQAFNFWYRRTAVDSLLAEQWVAVPFAASICAQAVSFRHLHKSFGKVGSEIQGLDYSAFDSVQRHSNERLYPLPVYMYEHVVVSETVELANIQYRSKVHSIISQHKLKWENLRANAIVVYVKYQLDAKGERVLDLGPKVQYCKQCVHFLDVAHEADSVCVDFKFDVDDGSIQIRFIE